MTAEFSSCNTYRYVLTRKLESHLRWVKPCLFIMLNPSTADAFQDDPTIRRCIGFARREGCTDLTVVNLFALRSTDPKKLFDHKEPIGPLNDQKICEQIEKHWMGLTVAAWGAHPMALERAETLSRYDHIKCLGKTKNGSPSHPLYLKRDAVLVDLNPRS